MNAKIAYRHIDLSYLDLMTEGDFETRQLMLSMLCDELPIEFEKMRAAWREGDMGALKSVSHKMKSTLAFVGNEQMAIANRAIEQIAMGNASDDALPVHFEAIQSLIEETLAELAEAASA